MMIYHGFHYDQEKQLGFVRNRKSGDSVLSWRRLALGFGLSGAILSMIALIFLTSY